MFNTIIGVVMRSYPWRNYFTKEVYGTLVRYPHRQKSYLTSLTSEQVENLAYVFDSKLKAKIDQNKAFDLDVPDFDQLFEYANNVMHRN